MLSGHVQDVKEQFRTGMYEATTINSELTSAEGLFEVTQHSVQGHLHTYMLQKAEQLSNSELIRAVAERAELRAISEKMPSMQEIFLRVVGGSSSFNSQP